MRQSRGLPKTLLIRSDGAVSKDQLPSLHETIFKAENQFRMLNHDRRVQEGNMATQAL